ncbi:MAG TPA: hypothetical protein VJN22_02170 [Candidatus Eremiobacteraceae bacterium]|nr:hypothetical protein [Candidatus Eremiobacteraceae bacterium]
MRAALPMAPSSRSAAADRLYQDIVSACASAATAAGKSNIDIDIVRAHLATLGPPENYAQTLASGAAGGATWQWPGDRVADAFRSGRIHEHVDEFAKVAAEKGERVARISVDAAASALEIASEKLREFADMLKKNISL